MKKTVLLILLSGLTLVFLGCGKSAQERVAEEQLKEIEQKKVDDERRKGIMGDGKIRKIKPGEALGGL